MRWNIDDRQFILLKGHAKHGAATQLIVLDEKDPEEEMATYYSWNILENGLVFPIHPKDRKLDEWEYAEWGELPRTVRGRILSLVYEIDLEMATLMSPAVTVTSGGSDYTMWAIKEPDMDNSEVFDKLVSLTGSGRDSWEFVEYTWYRFLYWQRGLIYNVSNDGFPYTTRWKPSALF
jgi:hypothetical protein